MTTDITSFTIGALADAAAVNVETIRFYQRKGLMPSPVRPSGSIRRYAATDLARVRFIKSAQRLGFSLDEVSDLLRLEDGTHCGEARALAERKLQDVRDKLAVLRRIESALGKLVVQCGSARGAVTCPLIASLQQGRRQTRPH
jgi:MerR family mercuric resistance operon transcriptional regulator